MAIKPSLVADRVLVLNAVNKDLESESLPHVEVTNRAFISNEGVIWHELRDDHGYLTYATSYPFSGDEVTAVGDEREASDFDTYV